MSYTEAVEDTPAPAATVSTEPSWWDNMVNAVSGIFGGNQASSRIDPNDDNLLDMTSHEYIKELDDKAFKDYDTRVNYAKTERENAMKLAEQARTNAKVEAEALFRQNASNYGLQGERMLDQGLAGGGYSEFLEGKNMETRALNFGAANSEYMNNAQNAQTVYNQAVKQAGEQLMSAQDVILDKQHQYSEEIRKERDAYYEKLLSEVTSGLIDANTAWAMFGVYDQMSSKEWAAIQSAANAYEAREGKALARQIYDDLINKYGAALTKDIYIDSLIAQGADPDLVEKIANTAFDENGKLIAAKDAAERLSTVVTMVDAIRAGTYTNLNDAKTILAGMLGISEYELTSAEKSMLQAAYNAYLSGEDESRADKLLNAIATMGAEIPMTTFEDFLRNTLKIKSDAKVKEILNEMFDDNGLLRLVADRDGTGTGSNKAPTDKDKYLDNMQDSINNGSGTNSGTSSSTNNNSSGAGASVFDNIFGALGLTAGGAALVGGAAAATGAAGAAIGGASAGSWLGPVGALAGGAIAYIVYRLVNDGNSSVLDQLKGNGGSNTVYPNGGNKPSGETGENGETGESGTEGGSDVEGGGTEVPETPKSDKDAKATYQFVIDNIKGKKHYVGDPQVVDDLTGEDIKTNDYDKNGIVDYDLDALQNVANLFSGVARSDAKYLAGGSFGHFTVIMDGTEYMVREGDTVHINKEVSDLVNSGALKPGEVFGYDRELYMVKGDKIIKIEPGFFRNGDYEPFWKELYGKAIDVLAGNSTFDEDKGGVETPETGTTPDESTPDEKDPSLKRGHATMSYSLYDSGWTVNVDGFDYSVIRGEVIEDTALNREILDAAKSVDSGEVFVYDDILYYKDEENGRIYEVTPRRQSDYNKVKNAITANAETWDKYTRSANKTGGTYTGGDLAKGKTVNVEKGGETYKFEIDAVMGADTEAAKAANAAGIGEGEVFRHREDMYVYKDGKAYKLSAVAGFRNWHYDAFVEAATGQKTWPEGDFNYSDFIKEEATDNKPSGGTADSGNSGNAGTTDNGGSQGGTGGNAPPLEGDYTKWDKNYVNEMIDTYGEKEVYVTLDEINSIAETTESAEYWGSKLQTKTETDANGNEITVYRWFKNSNVQMTIDELANSYDSINIIQTGGPLTDFKDGKGQIKTPSGKTLNVTLQKVNDENAVFGTKIKGANGFFTQTTYDKNNKPTISVFYANKDGVYQVTDEASVNALLNFQKKGKFDSVSDAIGNVENYGYWNKNNIDVVVGDKTYRVEIGAKLDASKYAEVINSANDAGIQDGEVFAYGNEMFIKNGGEYHKIDQQDWLFYDHDEKLLEALKTGEKTERPEIGEAVQNENDKVYATDNIKPGTNQTIQVDGKSYAIQINQKITAGSPQFEAAKNIGDKEFFAYGDKLYVKIGDGVYSVTGADADALKGIVTNGLGDKEAVKGYAASVTASKMPMQNGNYTAYFARTSIDFRKSTEIADTVNNKGIIDFARNLDDKSVFVYGDDAYYKENGKVYLADLQRETVDTLKGYLKAESEKPDISKGTATEVYVDDQVTKGSNDWGFKVPGWEVSSKEYEKYVEIKDGSDVYLDQNDKTSKIGKVIGVFGPDSEEVKATRGLAVAPNEIITVGDYVYVYVVKNAKAFLMQIEPVEDVDNIIKSYKNSASPMSYNESLSAVAPAAKSGGEREYGYSDYLI